MRRLTRWTLLCLHSAMLLGAACGTGEQNQCTVEPCPPDTTKPKPDPQPSQLQGGCSIDRFCWENPRPLSARLNSFWGRGNAAWAVGDSGVIFNWQQDAWQVEFLPTFNALYSIFSPDDKTIWAGGDGSTLLFRTPDYWQQIENEAGGSIKNIFGVGTQQVWALSSIPDKVLRLIDSEQRSYETMIDRDALLDVRKMWKSERGTAWAVGMGGRILRGDGLRWQDEVPSGTTATLHDVWGSSDGDVWAVGDGGTVIHWDGRNWNSSPSGNMNSLRALYGLDASTIFAAGDMETILRWDGARWIEEFQEFPGTQRILGIWGRGLNDLKAVTVDARTLHRAVDGKWSELDPANRLTLSAMWGGSSASLWAVGAGNIGAVLHRNGYRWDQVPVYNESGTTKLTIGELGELKGIWGSGPDDIWAVGFGSGGTGGAILHWDGQKWRRHPDAQGLAAKLDGVFVVNEHEAWAVGGTDDNAPGFIMRWDGAHWQPQPTPPAYYLSSVWGTSGQDLWAVGAHGSVIHFDGSTWTAQNTPAADYLHSLYGSGPNDVWAVGDYATIIQYDGTGWQPRPESGYTEPYYAVWSSGPGDVWISGYKGKLMHREGERWQNYTSGTSNDLRSIFGLNRTDFWVIGVIGTILRHRE